MAKAEATVEELVGMIERGELRLPEMQRRYVWRSTRVRDLLDSLYRGYPSGTILLWQTDEAVPQQEFAVAQQGNPYQSTRLLLDGQQLGKPAQILAAIVIFAILGKTTDWLIEIATAPLLRWQDAFGRHGGAA